MEAVAEVQLRNLLYDGENKNDSEYGLYALF